MKPVTKWLITASAVAGVAMGAGALHAATVTTNTQSPFSNLVSAIATKFNLNPSDVQQVFDAQHQQIQQQMHERQSALLKTRLDQAVKDGKLTQAQEDLIVTKHTEVQTFMEGLVGKSAADRQTAIQSETDMLTQWAKDNNIPTEYAPLAHEGFGGGRGFHGERQGEGMSGMMGGRGAWQK